MHRSVCVLFSALALPSFLPSFWQALREDLLRKMALLTRTASNSSSKKSATVVRDHRLVRELSEHLQRHLGKGAAVVALCRLLLRGDLTYASIEQSAHRAALMELLDGDEIGSCLQSFAGAEADQSFLSLQTAREQLAEWGEAAADAERNCSTEYELLMYVVSPLRPSAPRP